MRLFYIKLIRIVEKIFLLFYYVIIFKRRINMRDYSFLFVIIDDLIEEVNKTEENLIINHTIK